MFSQAVDAKSNKKTQNMAEAKEKPSGIRGAEMFMSPMLPSPPSTEKFNPKVAANNFGTSAHLQASQV